MSALDDNQDVVDTAVLGPVGKELPTIVNMGQREY